MSGPPGRRTLWLVRPPRMLAVAALVWLTVLVVQNSDAGIGIVGLFTWVFGAAAIAVVWMVRLVLFFVLRGHRPDVRMSRWFAVPPVVILCSLLIGLLDAPGGVLFRMRFAASEPALTREAEALISTGDRHDQSSRRIGLFTVARTSVFEGQVRFITTPCGVVDSCGVVYSPNGEPARMMEDRFTRLWNGWWHVFEGF